MNLKLHSGFYFVENKMNEIEKLKIIKEAEQYSKTNMKEDNNNNEIKIENRKVLTYIKKCLSLSIVLFVVYLLICLLFIIDIR